MKPLGCWYGVATFTCCLLLSTIASQEIIVSHDSPSFQCRNDSKTISKNNVCDGKNDCADGSDEQGCYLKMGVDKLFLAFLRDEFTARVDLERQLVKCSSEMQYWKTKHETMAQELQTENVILKLNNTERLNSKLHKEIDLLTDKLDSANDTIRELQNLLMERNQLQKYVKVKDIENEHLRHEMNEMREQKDALDKKIRNLTDIASYYRPYDNPICKTDDPGYEIDPSGDRCYKYHTIPKNREEALEVCGKEGAYLLELNSQQEAEHFARLGKLLGQERILVDFIQGNDLLSHYETSRGKQLEETGFSKWYKGQPENGGGQYLCGRLYFADDDVRNAGLYMGGCQYPFQFVCEKELK